MTPGLYGQLVEITEDYLGPAASRFIDRQIEFHLGKQPDEIADKDILKLAEWGKISLGMLTEDAQMVADFERRILALIPSTKK